MLIFIGAFLLLVTIYLVFKTKLNIDVMSFFRPTIPLDRGVFGVYCFTGKQGSGKTYSVVKFIKGKMKGQKVYSNVTFSGLDYTKLESLEQLMSLSDERDCIIVYDEIFTMMQKQTRFTEPMMTFLSQMRKQGNIFITTAQEWLELPMTYRRYVRIQIDCSTIPLGFMGGILKERYYDATYMVWSQLDNEYIAPIISFKISKYEKRYMQSYDTHERIAGLK